MSNKKFTDYPHFAQGGTAPKEEIAKFLSSPEGADYHLAWDGKVYLRGYRPANGGWGSVGTGGQGSGPIYRG
jgi:hypothetical protein